MAKLRRLTDTLYAVTTHAQFEVIRNAGVKINHIFVIFDPNLPILYNFYGPTMTIKGTSLLNNSIVKHSLEKSKSRFDQISTVCAII